MHNLSTSQFNSVIGGQSASATPSVDPNAEKAAEFSFNIHPSSANMFGSLVTAAATNDLVSSLTVGAMCWAFAHLVILANEAEEASSTTSTTSTNNNQPS